VNVSTLPIHFIFATLLVYLNTLALDANILPTYIFAIMGTIAFVRLVQIQEMHKRQTTTLSFNLYKSHLASSSIATN